jgi:hypothetical protein
MPERHDERLDRGAGGPHARPGGGSPDTESLRELEAVTQLLALLREIVPPELQAQLAEVARQVLLLVRAVLDWWVARLEPARGAAPEVEDIPVD